MNILVTSAGRRVKIIEYFKKNLDFSNNEKVVATDCDIYAPALYFADEYEIVPLINDPNYIDVIIDLCKKHQIDAVVSLIDPELEILAKSKSRFAKNNIQLILSPLKTLRMTFDKYETHQHLKNKGVSTVPTYNKLEYVLQLLEKGQLFYPLIVKPAYGSASIGLFEVNNNYELENAYYKYDNQIIQPYLKDKEYGVDVYVDMINGGLVDMFIKEKINMRSGETDKSISIYNSKIETLIHQLIKNTNFSGPIDIDVFESNGEYYISEINPRFGGGYPHAYEMGCDFMKNIKDNIKGISNNKYQRYHYYNNQVMLKFDEVKIVEP